MSFAPFKSGKWGKGRVEENVRFAMGVKWEQAIFLRLGGKNGSYLVVRELSVPLPSLERKL